MVRFYATEKGTTNVLPPYAEYKKHLDDLKKKYPGLFPTEKQDIANQQKCIDAAWDPKTMQANVDSYNAAFKNLWDNWGLSRKGGERYEKIGPQLLRYNLKDLDADYLLENKPQPFPLRTEDWEVMDRKMAFAAEKVAKIDEMIAVDLNSLPTDAARRLHQINLDKLKQAVKDWFVRVHLDDDNDTTMSGLPFDSMEMELVLMEVRNKKENRDFFSLTQDQQVDRLNKIAKETWDSMYDKIIVHRHPERTKKEYEDLVKAYHEVLDPTDMSLGRIDTTTKTLFCQAYWYKGPKGVEEVSNALAKLWDMFNNYPADIVEQWKSALRLEKNLTLSGEVALFVKALEPRFVLKMINEIRREYTSQQFTRTCHKVMATMHQHDYDTQYKRLDDMEKALPPLEDAKAELRELCFDMPERADDVVFPQKEIARHKFEFKDVLETKLDWPVPTIDELVQTVVYDNLWMQENDSRTKEVDAFIEELKKAMASGKADIVALENKCKSLLPAGLVSNEKPVDDIEYCRTAMAYSRGVRKRMDLWSFKDAFQADHDKKDGKILWKRQRVAEMMKGQNFPDPIVRMVKHLIETQRTHMLEKICQDYDQILKRYRGEVYGKVTSSAELSDKEFKEIVDVLQKQNPGKKYFLDRDVNPSLVAGFVIQCGPQKIDYSLAAQLNQLKKAVNV
jgi:ATP synthase F1 delta subunit